MPSQVTAEKDGAAGVSPAAPWRVKAYPSRRTSSLPSRLTTLRAALGRENLARTCLALLIMLPVLLWGGEIAYAEEPRSVNYQIEIGLQDCIADAGNDIQRRVICYKVPQELVESELNQAFEQLMVSSAITDRTKAELRVAQEKWKQFRDLDCRLREGMEMNGPWPFVAMQKCYLQQTIQRTNELNWMAIIHLPVWRRKSD